MAKKKDKIKGDKVKNGAPQDFSKKDIDAQIAKIEEIIENKMTLEGKMLTDKGVEFYEEKRDFMLACRIPDDADISQYPCRMKQSEFEEIAQELADYHSVFNAMWRVGKPIFSPMIPTAAVFFSQKSREPLEYMINPFFWEKLSFDSRVFVIAHECLHVILEHGIRSKDSDSHNETNISQDIIINHLLVDKFGLERRNINFGGQFCWDDTVFNDENGDPMKSPVDQSDIIVESDKAYEYYFNVLMDNKDVSQGNGEGDEEGNGQGGGNGSGNGGGNSQFDNGWGGVLVDWHMTQDEQDAAAAAAGISKVIDHLNDVLSDEDKEDIKDMIGEHNSNYKFEGDADTQTVVPNQEKDTTPHSPGRSAGNGVFIFPEKKVKPKEKFTKVIRNWVNKKRYVLGELDSWRTTNHRYDALNASLPLRDQLTVPNEVYDDDGTNKNRIRAWLFMDTSGSCTSYAERFWTVAESIPKKYFDLKLLCFDTRVYDCNLKDRKLYGFGGTYFHIMEDRIQAYLRGEGYGQRYPDAVFVLTDGYGDQIQPAHPENWYWFMVEHGSDSYISKDSHVYELADFEEVENIKKF